MSEFSCRYHHLMRSRDTFCLECLALGRVEGVYYMDGMSARELQQRERWEEEQAQRDYEAEDDEYPD